MKKMLLFVLLCCFSFAFSQKQIKGKVIDNETTEGIPFVKIGLKDKDLGTISDENGNYSISIPNEIPNDAKLLFEIIGYETTTLPLNSIQSNQTIELEKRSIQLGEAVIKSKRGKLKTKKLGGYKKSIFNTGNANTGKYGKGEEFGIKVKALKNPYYVKRINFHTKHNTMDSILFRLNVYSIGENGLPNETLLTKPLFVKSYNGDGWIRKDLDFRLRIKEDVVVTIEPITLWYDENNVTELFYSQCKGRKQSFHRNSSFAKWEKNSTPPFAIYFDAEYYKK